MKTFQKYAGSNQCYSIQIKLFQSSSMPYGCLPENVKTNKATLEYFQCLTENRSVGYVRAYPPEKRRFSYWQSIIEWMGRVQDKNIISQSSSH